MGTGAFIFGAREVRIFQGVRLKFLEHLLINNPLIVCEIVKKTVQRLSQDGRRLNFSLGEGAQGGLQGFRVARPIHFIYLCLLIILTILGTFMLLLSHLCFFYLLSTTSCNPLSLRHLPIHCRHHKAHIQQLGWSFGANYLFLPLRTPMVFGARAADGALEGERAAEETAEVFGVRDNTIFRAASARCGQDF